MAEHAFGLYNKSNKASNTIYDAGNTFFSIGMGFSEDHRENAVEVMQNSDVYIRGIGDYDGTNPGDASTLKEVIDSKADSTDLNDYVKKINNPFAVGSGTQSAFQKNPDHPNTASGNSSVAIGADNEATKIGSFAANRKNHATGDDSNATGYGNTASGDTSHAEGYYTTASGKYSHTEGHGTTASNDGTHAEGWNSKATGDTSHAEGHGTVAGGPRSHTEGKYTKTSNDSEHAQGIYNKTNTGTIHSIGIGTSDSDRKNAVEVLNNGKVYITGIGDYDGTNPSNNNSLQSLISTFITKSVNDLANYYSKSDTYSKQEIENLIGAINQFHYEIHPNLQFIKNPQPNVLYLIGPKRVEEGQEPLSDKYEEYVYANNEFVKIGDTSIDLSGYVKDEELNEALANYVTSSAFLDALAGKQDKISDLDEIRSGAALGRSAVQTDTEQTLTEEQKAQARTNIGAGTSDFSGAYEELTGKPAIPKGLADLSDDASHRTVTDAEKTSWNAKYAKPSGGIPKSDLAGDVQTSLEKADSALQEHQSLAAYVNGGSYNSTTKKIELKHGTTVLAEIDATAFIKDGMVSDVQITGGNLVISFNTDSGKEAITIPLTDIFDPANYYTKPATNELLATKYTKPATGIPATDLSEAVQESLAKADNPSTEVFWATHGETTAAEIDEAVSAGKVVMCRYNGTIYVQTQEINGTIYFGSVHNDYTRRLELKRSDNTWSGTSIQLEWTGHKVTSWNATPNNTAYPSEKLVKDSLDSKYTKPSTGIPASDIAEGVIPEQVELTTSILNDLFDNA